MDDQQKKNLLDHADFLDKVVNVKFSSGIEMAVYYSTNDLSGRKRNGIDRRAYAMSRSINEPALLEDGHDLLTPLPEEGPCGFSACAIGWAAKSDLPKPTEDEGWDEYSNRIFGINNWDENQGAYCFSAALNITDASEIATRIRRVVAAYPDYLLVNQEDIAAGAEMDQPSSAIAYNPTGADT